LAIYIIRFGWTKRAWWLWAGVLLGLVALGPASAHSVREFFAGWVMSFVPLAVGVAIFLWFFRHNLLAYLAAAFCLQVAQPLVSLLSQQAVFYRSNGLLLAVLAFLILVWLLLAGRQSEARSEP
jgi:ABC-type transport system involved in cytochrome c biogenesis permease component